MKYRTMIELVCDAADKEEASHIAGDYLKGDIDFGVEMKCNTTSVVNYRVKKCVTTCVIVLVMFSAVLLRLMPVEMNEHAGTAIRSRGLSSTYTIMPVLKTKHKSDFKKEWEQKKDEEILKFLKK